MKIKSVFYVLFIYLLPLEQFNILTNLKTLHISSGPTITDIIVYYIEVKDFCNPLHYAVFEMYAKYYCFIISGYQEIFLLNAYYIIISYYIFIQ